MASIAPVWAIALYVNVYKLDKKTLGNSTIIYNLFSKRAVHTVTAS